MKRLLIVVCVFLGTAGASNATTNHPKFDEVASKLAAFPVTTLCFAKGEPGNPDFYNAYAYTYLNENKLYLNQDVCEGLLSLPSGDPDLMTLGIMALTHEALHQHRSWSNRGDEAKTQCRTMQRFRYATYLLTGDDILGKILYHPYATNLNDSLPWNYRDWTCKFPSAPGVTTRTTFTSPWPSG